MACNNNLQNPFVQFRNANIRSDTHSIDLLSRFVGTRADITIDKEKYARTHKHLGTTQTF